MGKKISLKTCCISDKLGLDIIGNVVLATDITEGKMVSAHEQIKR